MFSCYNTLVLWHHSLAVRTHASHAWDRSSILRGATKKEKTPTSLVSFYSIYKKHFDKKYAKEKFYEF